MTTTGSARHPARLASGVGLCGFVLLGIILRLASFTHAGLFQDDAWVALTGRVPLGTAARMAGTSPGFILGLHPYFAATATSARWSELPAFVIAMIGIAMTFPIVRRVTNSAVSGAVATIIVALSPVAIATSTHVKPYTLDYLDGLVIVGLGYAALIDVHPRRSWQLLGASLVTLLLSASILPVVVGVWMVIALDIAVGQRRSDRRIVPAALSAVGVATLALTVYGNLPTVLHRYWVEDLLTPAPLSTLPHRASTTVRGLVTGLLPTTTKISGDVLLVTVVAVVLLSCGLLEIRRSRAVQVTTAVVLTAVACSVLGRIPLGTGRTDMAIYPALILIALAGGARLSRALLVRWPSGRIVVASLVIAGLVAAGAVAIAQQRPYPATNLGTLVPALSSCGARPPLVVVDAYTRYPWALTESPRFTLEFSSGYGAGFTVAHSSTAIVLPAQPYEVGYTPVAWAQSVERTAGALQPIAYVETPPTGVAHIDPFSLTVEHDGYRVVRTVRADATTLSCFTPLGHAPMR